MANIGIIDCLFLLAIIQASLMTLTRSNLIPVVFEFSSAFHIVYEWVLHFLALILALNRMLIILDLEFRFCDLLFKILTYLIWISILVLLFFFNKYDMNLVYVYDDNAFALNACSKNREATSTVYDIYYYADLTTISSSFVCYLAVIVAIVAQKLQFRKGIKIEKHEIRVFFQGLVTFLPGAAYWGLNMLAAFKFSSASLAVNIIFSILPRLVPVLNVSGYLILNSYVRESLATCVQRLFCRKSPTVKSISLASGNVNVTSVSVKSTGYTSDNLEIKELKEL
ncbi:hypothetical protein L596_026917 [Steinernema carpocapsae]|nr:hypothetical protein L596_026917 [Steinernema carpocapsae]